MTLDDLEQPLVESNIYFDLIYPFDLYSLCDVVALDPALQLL